MKKWLAVSVVVLGSLALGRSPALGQIIAGSQELAVHLGTITGDELTQTAISGKTPELENAFAVGVGYTYNVTRHWGVEGRYIFSPSTAENTPRGDIDLYLNLLDANVLYYLNPRDPVVAYGTAGIGVAVASLDENIVGTANSQAVTLEDSAGVTFNVGGGVKYFLAEPFFLRADARYRFIGELVDSLENELNTAELTVGIGWNF